MPHTFDPFLSEGLHGGGAAAHPLELSLVNGKHRIASDQNMRYRFRF
jgi:hypothetical protein